jgi:protein-S-isoprenylcysteine O-methyltransferase Ste14
MSIPKLVAGVVFNVAFFALLLFVPAGTLRWWRAWMFLAVTVAVMAVAIFSIFPDNADLFSQRAKGLIQRISVSAWVQSDCNTLKRPEEFQKGQPLWDRVLVILLVLSYVGQLVFIPLDVFRFHLAPKPGGLVSFLGLALYVAGWRIMTLAMKVNPFAVTVVRLQEERHQRVIDTGVYTVVRHPMYAGFIPMVVGPALWLGSYTAALLAIVPIAVLAVRSVFEERFLKRELSGYEAYTEKVRYRLIPFVW